MVGVRAVAAAVVMSCIVAACAASSRSPTPGPGATPSLGAPSNAPLESPEPSASPAGLADRVLGAIESGQWTGAFRLSGTISVRHGAARPEVRVVRGSFGIAGHDSSSFVEITTGATTRSTELVIVGAEAWRRSNGGSAYPTRRDLCLDFPDMLLHATAFEDEGPTGSNGGLVVSRLRVTGFTPIDCAQGYALTVLVTSFPTLVGWSIDRTRTIDAGSGPLVEVTKLKATWWAPTATIRPLAGTWRLVDDTIDMLDLAVPQAWRTAVKDGVQVISDARASIGIRIVTAPAQGRTLAAVVTQERARLLKLARSALGTSGKRDVGGFPAQVMTYHFVAGGHRQFGIVAITVHDGMVTELTWTRPAGHEPADQELFDAILGTLAFYG